MRLRDRLLKIGLYLFLAPALVAPVFAEPPSGAPAAAKVARNTAPAATSQPHTGTPIIKAEADLVSGLPPYLPEAPVAGELNLAGSSAMSQLAQLWADGLRHVHDKAKISVRTFESGQVLPELAAGHMQFGLMSRPLTEAEIAAGGVIAIPTAKDVLGVVVNTANPINQINTEQGMSLLRDPKAAEAPGAATWGQLGLTGEWSKTPVNLYGRESGSGAWGYLVNRFLGPGAVSRQQKECDSYAQLCERVSKDRGGVGYVSLCLAPPKTGKVLMLATTAGDVVPAPRPGEMVDPKYPLVRELYLVVRWDPQTKLPAISEELLRYVLSRSGQEDAVKAGLIPLRRDEVLAARDQLGWTGLR